MPPRDPGQSPKDKTREEAGHVQEAPMEILEKQAEETLQLDCPDEDRPEPEEEREIGQI